MLLRMVRRFRLLEVILGVLRLVNRRCDLVHIRVLAQWTRRGYFRRLSRGNDWQPEVLFISAAS
jgi:hypothetical protein